MRKKIGLSLVFTGTVLFLMALSLFLCNRWQAKQAGDTADAVANYLISVIHEQTNDVNDESRAEEFGSKVGDATTDTVTLDGYVYMGVLSIPELGLKLPVMADWSYDGLKIAPCRYSGNTEGDNLVICAHNYERHFGNLKSLSLGATVIFTAMDGTVYTYQVTERMIIQPTATDQLVQGDWDLALYTCTIGGKTRVVVRCKLIE